MKKQWRIKRKILPLMALIDVKFSGKFQFNCRYLEQQMIKVRKKLARKENFSRDSPCDFAL